jgi:two-component system chemotaxis response regulator CheY
VKSLIVEDDYVSGLLLQKRLGEWGPAHVAFNGKEALEALRNPLETSEPYGLICLDIMMPDMDGLQVLKEIRALEAAMGTEFLNRAKIIMVTSLRDEDTVLEAIQGQCDHFLTKPLRKEKLLEILRKLALIA